MFGVVPRVLWQRQHPPDDLNRIAQALRPILIIDGQRNILVDTGNGNWHEDKFIKNYALHTNDFDSTLAVHNLTCDDITDVILTHLHFDHAGGFVTKKKSQISLTFPQARAWVQKEQLSWAQNPSPKDRASFSDIILKPLLECPRLEAVQGEVQITDKVSVIPFFGHTPAMQAVMVSTEAGKHFFATDLMPDVAHLHIPYISAYDNNPVITAQEKQNVLSDACRENWTIHFYHDPNASEGQVVQEGGKFGLKPL